MDTELGGTRENTDPQSDPHNEIAKFLGEAEKNQTLSAEDIAQARSLLGDIGSNPEGAEPEKVERLRQILEEADPAMAAKLVDNLIS